MQIIVTTEELRAHERSLNDWHMHRMSAAVNAAVYEATGQGTPERRWAGAAGDAATKYEATNPRPKLIPSV